MFELPLHAPPASGETITLEFWEERSSERYRLDIGHVKRIDIVGDASKGPGGDEMFNDFGFDEKTSTLSLKCSLAVKEVRLSVSRLEVTLTQIP